MKWCKTTSLDSKMHLANNEINSEAWMWDLVVCVFVYLWIWINKWVIKFYQVILFFDHKKLQGIQVQNVCLYHRYERRIMWLRLLCKYTKENENVIRENGIKYLASGIRQPLINCSKSTNILNHNITSFKTFNIEAIKH